MNFVADHQRAQEYLPTLYHHHDNNRQDQHYYPSPSPCPSTYSQPQSPLPPSPYSQSTSFSHTSSIRGTLPEVGQTRCCKSSSIHFGRRMLIVVLDWALLSTDLRFLVLDPVLAYHLREQANDILDTSLLEFVHPEERASAKEDLGGVLRERTLHGSVTRYGFWDIYTTHILTPITGREVYGSAAFLVCGVYSVTLLLKRHHLIRLHFLPNGSPLITITWPSILYSIGLLKA